MGLRLKISIILSVVWLAISLMMVIYSKSTLLTEYERLERNQTADDVQRTNNILTSLMSSLSLLTTNWSQWDDAYVFMKNKNQNFMNNNLIANTFVVNKLNLILFFDEEGKLFYGLNYDLKTNNFIPLPNDLIRYLESDPSFGALKQPGQNKIGILKTPEGYIVLNAKPILTSQGQGPIHGTLIMGYFLTNHQVENLSQIANIKVELFPIPPPINDNLLIAAYQALTKGAKTYVASVNSNTIYGFTFVPDINGQPIGMLRISSNRALYNQGIETIDRYLAILIGSGIIVLLLILYLLKKFMLDRMLNVSKQVIEINSSSEFSNRIAPQGNDELGHMVGAINTLMEIIELTQEQLKYRILLRTEELERLSKLNKNLYKEVSRQKLVENSLREGEQALRHLAYYDTLTNLPNRILFSELLQQTISQSKQSKAKFAVLFLDVDKFKSINDTHGHDSGDRFLKETAVRLKNSIKPTDIAARLSGDEFILIVEGVGDKQSISQMAEKLLQNLSISIKYSNTALESTYSIGISLYPQDGSTINELERHADLAMYHAKKCEGNAYCFYDEVRNNSLV